MFSAVEIRDQQLFTAELYEKLHAVTQDMGNIVLTFKRPDLAWFRSQTLI